MKCKQNVSTSAEKKNIQVIWFFWGPGPLSRRVLVCRFFLKKERGACVGEDPGHPKILLKNVSISSEV